MTGTKRIPPAVIRRVWLDRSIRLADAAARLGMTRQGLTEKARRLGLPPRGANYDLQKLCSDGEFTQLWEAGVLVADIAAEFGYSGRCCVDQRRRSLGLSPRKRGSRGIPIADYRAMQIVRRMAEVAAEEQRAVDKMWRRAA